MYFASINSAGQVVLYNKVLYAYCVVSLLVIVAVGGLLVPATNGM